ncbi:uncharacterized protein UV8b_04642 [Ustilaginoidea virens]|uniref:mRNA stability protein n=1 Tax=Ustilaginoidea virens TaxID=1159556 RepID=A0A063C4A8_USTVR|nr:uncharacterized protein UV8b_04642 [Ustilaginoidea virens]QUC20401.1 hypothetical protein UV8b_04642 [Ustilaginoidea virens]GAO14673.1 hypothetical protein UVI_02029120 [Ustilaginoidea virens]
MNPHLKNKVDVKSLSPEEQRLFRLYGKLPSRSDHFAKHLKERKYFDSGDYAMSKAGKGDGVDAGAVGSQHPVPENIPHLSSPVNNGTTVPKHGHHGSIAGIQAGSPVKESSILHRETSATEEVGNHPADAVNPGADNDDSGATSPPPQSNDGIPIRR